MMQTHTYTVDFNYWNRVLNILHPNIHVIKNCYRRMKFGWKIIATLIIYIAQKKLLGMTNNVRVTLIVGDTTSCGLQLVLSKTKKVGDAKYTIYYSVNIYYIGRGNIFCMWPEDGSIRGKKIAPPMHALSHINPYCKFKDIWVNSTQNLRLDTCS